MEMFVATDVHSVVVRFARWTNALKTMAWLCTTLVLMIPTLYVVLGSVTIVGRIVAKYRFIYNSKHLASTLTLLLHAVPSLKIVGVQVEKITVTTDHLINHFIDRVWPRVKGRYLQNWKVSHLSNVELPTGLRSGRCMMCAHTVGQIMAPALVTSNMFLKWISLKGVSLIASTRRLRSLSRTSAARRIRSSQKPAFTPANVFMLHGRIIMPSRRYEPLDTGAA